MHNVSARPRFLAPSALLTSRHGTSEDFEVTRRKMISLYSHRLRCLGSIVVSLLATLLLGIVHRGSVVVSC